MRFSRSAWTSVTVCSASVWACCAAARVCSAWSAASCRLLGGGGRVGLERAGDDVGGLEPLERAVGPAAEPVDRVGPGHQVVDAVRAQERSDGVHRAAGAVGLQGDGGELGARLLGGLLGRARLRGRLAAGGRGGSRVDGGLRVGLAGDPDRLPRGVEPGPGRARARPRCVRPRSPRRRRPPWRRPRPGRRPDRPRRRSHRAPRRSARGQRRLRRDASRACAAPLAGRRRRYWVRSQK